MRRTGTTATEDSICPLRTRIAGVLAVEAASSRAFGRHMHDEFGIGIVLSGAQDSASGRGPVRAERGQVITVNPGEVHDGVPVGGPRRWRMLYFRPEVLAPGFEAIGLPAGSELAHPVLDCPTVARAVLSLQEAVMGNPASDLTVESLLVEMIAGLTDRQCHRHGPATSAIAPARRMIDDTPEADFLPDRTGRCLRPEPLPLPSCLPRSDGPSPACLPDPVPPAGSAQPADRWRAAGRSRRRRRLCRPVASYPAFRPELWLYPRQVRRRVSA